MESGTLVLVILVTLAVGALAGVVAMRRALLPRLAEARQEAQETVEALTAQVSQARADATEALDRAHAAEVARAEAVGQRDAAVAQARSADETAQRAGALTSALGPLAERLDHIGRQVAEWERDRTSATGRLAEQIRSVQAMGEGLREQTASLAGALRSSNARGTWGEVQLRRIVEAAGMLARVDFDVQAHMTGAEGTAIRPDMVVRLPDGRGVVVDAKAPLALPGEAADDPDALAAAQAKKLRAHVSALAQKRYWAGVSSSPEFVVCFVPAESILSTALSADPSLIEDAMAQKVVPATPATLLAMLRTVAMTWREQAVHENAEEVLALGRELHHRLGTVADHADKVGRALDRAVGDYNKFVGSFEGRLLVTARKMTDLGLDGEVAAPRRLDSDTRALSAPELVAGDAGGTHRPGTLDLRPVDSTEDDDTAADHRGAESGPAARDDEFVGDLLAVPTRPLDARRPA